MGLTVYHNENIIFTDSGNWLHPLFHFYDFLETSDIPREELFLRDTVIGLGAAFMLIHMGIRKCHGVLMSRRAVPVLTGSGVEHSWDSLVDAVFCQTEDLLLSETDPARAFDILKERVRTNKLSKPEPGNG